MSTTGSWKQRRRVPVRGAAWLALMMLVGSACGQRLRQLGRQTTEGAISALDQDQGTPKVEPGVDRNITLTARQAAREAVDGALEGLQRPELDQEVREAVDAAVTQALRSALRTRAASATGEPGRGASSGASSGLAAQLAEEVANAFTAGLSNELVQQLGPSGEGPLARSLSSASQNAATNATDALFRSLEERFPECRGEADLLTCVEARLRSLGSALGSGVTQGARRSLAPWGYVAAAGAGLLTGILVTLLLSVRRLSQAVRRPQSPAPT